MKTFSCIVFCIALLSMAFGLYEYISERSFIKYSVATNAVIEHVNDEQISIRTEGRLNGPHEYIDHACKYAVLLNLPTHQTAVGHLTIIGKPCLPLGSSIAVVYDSRSPGDSVRGRGDQAMLPAGTLWIGFGVFLMFLSYLDRRKSKKVH
jgi:hypothetical protein